MKNRLVFIDVEGKVELNVERERRRAEGGGEGGEEESRSERGEEKENSFPQYLSISRRMHNPGKLEGIYSSSLSLESSGTRGARARRRED